MTLQQRTDAREGHAPQWRRDLRLVGRDAELAALHQFLDGLDAEGSARVLAGESGVGKTALINAVADIATRRGKRVIAATGCTSETDVEFAGLHKLLLPLLPNADRLSRSHRRALRAALGLDADSRVFDALVVYNSVLALLSASADEMPILLLVDDLHRLDRSTVRALSFVARRLANTRVGLLASSSTTESSSLLIDAPVIHLGRLGRSEAERLLATTDPDLDPHARDLLLQQADGNPLALRELRRVLGAEPEMLPAMLATTSTPESPFVRMVGELPERTRRAALVLALENDGDIRVLAHAGLGLEDLEPAERTGLIVVDLDTNAAGIPHPLARSAIVGLASSAERRAAHLALAHGHAGDAERMAFHLGQATIVADERTAALLEAASRSALARGDSGAAVLSLTRAARLSPAAVDRQRRIAQAAYLAIDLPGDRGLNSRLLAEARRVARRGSGAMYAAVATAFAHLHAEGDIGVALQIVRTAVENGTHGWDACEEELVHALDAWLLLCWTAGRKGSWAEYFAALDRLGPDAPEPLRTLSAALADPARTGSEERDRIRRMLLQRTEGRNPRYVVHLDTAARHFDLLALGRPDSWRLIEEGRRSRTTLGYVRALGQVCLDDFANGRWDDAQELADEGVAASVAFENEPVMGTFYYIQGLLAAARGSARECAEWLQRLDGVAARLDARGFQRLSAQVRVLAAAGAEDWESAYQHACALSPAGTFARYVPEALPVAYDLVEAAMRTGRVKEARAHQTAMVTTGLASMSTRLALATAAAGALVAGASTWRQSFERALALPASEDWPFDRARVLLAYGARLRRERHAMEARTQLHRALEVFEALGATPWIDRTRSELRIARERISVPEARSPLTPQELVVAELAAEGFSNREIGDRLFLSPRTVGGHLYRIFPKLGIASRSALRDALALHEH